MVVPRIATSVARNARPKHTVGRNISAARHEVRAGEEGGSDMPQHPRQSPATDETDLRANHLRHRYERKGGQRTLRTDPTECIAQAIAAFGIPVPRSRRPTVQVTGG
jgi:hypothetical protein